jgi:hypothetical protein
LDDEGAKIACSGPCYFKNDNISSEISAGKEDILIVEIK